MAPLDDLKRELADGRVVVVAGAGVTVAATQDPETAWPGLLRSGIAVVEQLAGAVLRPGWADSARADASSPNVRDVLSVAGRITAELRAQRPGEFRKWLEETAGQYRAKDTRLLDAIVNLGTPIATTNYDDLLERASGRREISWNESSKVAQWLRGRREAVLHLHGHWDDPDHVVLGPLSYDSVVRDELVAIVIRDLMISRTVLFVGMGAGLGDPNFETLRGWSRRVLGTATHRHYRLVRDSELAHLTKEHIGEPIHCIPYGASFDDLPPFLDSLRPTPPPVQAGTDELRGAMQGITPGSEDLLKEVLKRSAEGRPLSIPMDFIRSSRPEATEEHRSLHERLRDLRSRNLIRPEEGGPWDKGKHVLPTAFGKLAVGLLESAFPNGPSAESAIDPSKAAVVWYLPRGFLVLNDLHDPGSDSWAVTLQHYAYGGESQHGTHFHASYADRWSTGDGLSKQLTKLRVPEADARWAIPALDLAMDIRLGSKRIGESGRLQRSLDEAWVEIDLGDSGVLVDGPTLDAARVQRPARFEVESAAGMLRDVVHDADLSLSSFADVVERSPSAVIDAEAFEALKRTRREARVGADRLKDRVSAAALANLEEVLNELGELDRLVIPGTSVRDLYVASCARWLRSFVETADMLIQEARASAGSTA